MKGMDGEGVQGSARDRETLKGVCVLVMADLPLAAEGIAALFELRTGAEAKPIEVDLGPDRLREIVEDTRPTTVVWSTNDVCRSCTAPIVALREQIPLGVVLIVNHIDRDALTDLLVRGNQSVAVLRRCVTPSFDDVVRAVEDVHAGRSSLDPGIFEALLEEPESPGLAELTPSEREVAELLAEGLRNCTIAERLVKSERTVEKHVAGVFTKLGLSGETDVDRRVKAARIVLNEQQDH